MMMVVMVVVMVFEHHVHSGYPCAMLLEIGEAIEFDLGRAHLQLMVCEGQVSLPLS